MGIADTLFEAADEIRGYMARSKPGDSPGEIDQQLSALLADMDRIRILLDTPPELSKDELQRARLANAPAKGTA